MIPVATVRLKNVASLNDEQLDEHTDPDCLFEYVDVGAVGRGHLVDQPDKVTFAEAPTRARRLIRKGDTIVSTVRTYLRAILPIGPELSDVVVSTGFAVVRPRSTISPRFLAWSLQGDPFVEEVVARSTGVSYPAIAPSTMTDIALTVPVDRKDQKLIADFLDRETHRIDALVDAKRRMIDLLEEKRDSERSHLVFQGSSKIVNDWQQLPEGWTSRSVKYVTRLKSGTNITSDEIEEGGSPYPVYGGNGLRGYTYGFTHRGRHVLIGRQGALAGNINYTVDGPFFASEHAVVATPLIDAPSTWLGETLRAMNLNQYSTTAAQPGLAVEFIGRLKMPVPPPSERHRIAEALDRSNHLFNSVAHALMSQLDLLAEYRQALITQAVTGQLDEATLKGDKPVGEAVGVIAE